MRSRLSIILWAGLALCSVAFVGESIYRAAAFPITHDEALSFAIYAWDHSWADSPNNHLLNTQLMRVCWKLFGSSELSLRLPNVAAHVVYLGAILMLLSRVRRALVVPAFALLTLNLFQFDFFAMARGYGLELAGIAASLLFFVRAVDAKAGGTASLPWFGLAVMAGAGSTMANLSALFFYAPFGAVSAWLMLTDESHVRPRRGGWFPVAAILGTAGLCSLLVIARGLRMQQERMLYVGGATGFFNDTVMTLVQGSFFAPPYDDHAVRITAVTLVAVVAVFAALAAWSAWRARRFATVPVLTATMLIVAILLPVAQHALTGLLLPIGRWGLYLAPLAWVMVIFTADAGMTSLGRWRVVNVIALWVVATAVAGLVAVGFSPVRSYDGFTDTHIKDVLTMLDADRRTAFPGEKIAVADSWELEPVLNYYRVTRRLAWLMPAKRDPVEVGNNHYVYGLARDLTPLAAVPHVELASFPDSGTALWRVRRPANR